MYKSIVEEGNIIRYILHSDGIVQRTMIWYEKGKRKTDWVIVAVDASEETFEMIILEAERKRKTL